MHDHRTRRAHLGSTIGALIAAACSPSKPSEVRSRPTVEKRFVRVGMPTTLDHVARVDRARDQQASRGEALRDGVEVEVVPVGIGSLSHEPEDVSRLAIARKALAAGQRLDVLWTPFVDLGDLHRDGHLAPIRTLAARDHVDLKAYAPQALQPAFAPDAGLMALPDAISARQVYFRTDHLAEAGVDFRRAGLDFEAPKMTWDTLRRVALDAHASPAGRPRFAFDPTHDTLPAAAWAWQSGLPVAKPSSSGSGALVDALRWLASLATELNMGHTRKVPNRTVAARYGTVGPVPDAGAIPCDDGGRHPLLSGTSTLTIDSTRLVSTIASFDASLPIRVVELPRRDPKARAVGWSEVSGYALMAGSGDDAWDLLRFLTSEDAAYASARAVAMRLAPIERPSPNAKAPDDLPGGPRWWFPPFTGRLALDRFMARLYRTGVKALDEANDHGMEQIRHVGIIPFAPGNRAWLTAIETARRLVLREGRDPVDVARETLGAI